MASPLYWQGQYFFYPIGNTSAVCLTRDIAPEDPANILLLGCGDPRSVLYTILCEPEIADRKLDFTCCDFDPGVLARNVLLLSIIPKKQSYTAVWNLFYHMYLDKESHSVLIEHCRELIKFSENLAAWNASPFGRVIKMCTEYTLTELRRHWTLYVDMNNLPPAHLKCIRDAFTKQSKEASQNSGTILSSARSSGPLMVNASELYSKAFRKYWKTGVTFTDPQKIASAKLLNPTFVYSLVGEGCSVHYGSDPMIAFHLAPLFGNAAGSITIADLVKAAKAEFNDWCTAYKDSISSPSSSVPVVRFFLAEATAACRALHAFATTGTLNLGLPAAQWKTQLIKLDGGEYVTGGAPSSFNVIETSNLDDHIGLLNVLITTVPLLAQEDSVLYTESLLYFGEDATKEFARRLYSNITSISLILGLCPLDYLSGFSTRSNTHELMMYIMVKGDMSQFHQVTTWKSPGHGDAIAARLAQGRRPPVFDPHQLGSLLYDMYHLLFEQEDTSTFQRLNQNMERAISASNMIYYVREGFVLLLKLVKERLCICETQWLEVMDRFITHQEADQSMPMDSVNYLDLCAHMHRHNVYTSRFFCTMPPKTGRFLHWESVPNLVRIILVVPRENLDVLESSQEIASPHLHCVVQGIRTCNVFSTVHVASGSVIPMGTKCSPRVVFNEDPKGRKGSSSLVASFTMPAYLLTELEPPEVINVSLCVRFTLATAPFVEKLGSNLRIFTAKVMDESHVYVLPEQPLPSKPVQPLSSTHSSRGAGPLAQLGVSGPATVQLDEECELVETLACMVSIEAGDVKQLFRDGAMPEIIQISPCVMRLTIRNYGQDVIYPFPVIGSAYKLRLARKSSYIEVVIPVSGPFKPEGIMLNRFPVVRTGRSLTPWNIHRLNLSRLPILNIKAKKLDEWLDSHIGSMMSSRERSLRKKHKEDALMFIKDSIHAIFVLSAGIQSQIAQRLFALRDEETNNCDTVIFISEMRFDLHCHTVVCDGYVLPLTHSLLRTIESDFAKLATKGGMANIKVGKGAMRSWKQLLPALVERCRSSWQHEDCCEYLSQGKIPLSEEIEANPLCSCGRGKDVEGMLAVGLWRKLAPHVTRIALSPLFAVSYLETVIRDPSARRCFVCRGKGKPKLMTCARCQKVRYCCGECQKKDWKSHKSRCKPR